MLSFIAHAGETDSVASENAAHFLENWYYALPLFILAIAGIGLIVYLISKRSVANTFFSVVGALLLCGVYLYDKSPVLSAVAITIGLFGSLLSVLAVLSGPNNSKK